MITFAGSPTAIGTEYGREFAAQIRENVRVLVRREGYQPLPWTEPGFVELVQRETTIISIEWPWLIEEMSAVAAAAEVKTEEIVLLNLRAWQYSYEGLPALQACSSMAVLLTDGTLANVGALDDGIQYYCGPVRVVPERGFRYITFPITGTSWGNRGMNSVGLVVGESSQATPGLRRLPEAINSDLAMRVILQTCGTVEDVQHFCRRHPFTMNLVCTDANGHVFCAHQTAAGLLELPSDSPRALTNHVFNDRLRCWFYERGCIVPDAASTHLRRGRMLEFLKECSGRCTADEVRAFVADPQNGAPTSLCPPGNVAVTYGNSQAEPGTYWVAQPQVQGKEAWTPLAV